MVLEVASAGVFLHAGIKFPYFVFFAKDNGLRPGEPPKHMLAAMAILAFLCVFLGLYPQPLYAILPYTVDFHAYTFEHTLNQLQLLMFSALAFFLLLPLLKRTETISLDSDWFYRKGGPLFFRGCAATFDGLNAWANRVFAQELPRQLGVFFADAGGHLQRYGVRLWAEFSGTERRSAQLEAEITRRHRNAAYPIGGGVLLAVLLMALLSLTLLL
jgi:multicomponent Na+:H+ antiporter subunit D